MIRQEFIEKKVHVWFCTIAFVLWTGFVFAQLPSEVSNQLSKLTPRPALKSPNVSAIEKYGDYNVNLYTGLPEISIQIFEVQSGPLRVPITLTYHASGFKYTDQPSWVGLGWSIQAGGQVSRNIIGKPDESSFLTLTNDYNVPGGPDCSNLFYKENTVNGGNDREPDLFSFNFPSGSGKFYLRQGTAAPFLFPHQPIKIERSSVNYFDLTDERGVIHRFGSNWVGAAPARETLYSQSGGNVTTGTVAWHLQEMKSPNTDDFVSISYQTVGTLENSDYEYNLAVIDQCSTTNPVDLPCISNVGVQQQISTFSQTTQLGINEILFKTGKVRFVLGTNRTDLPSAQGIKKLDRIEVYRKDGLEYFLVKVFQFNTGYFRNFNNTADAYLKLNEVVVKDGAGSIINNYKFDYHTNTVAWARPNAGNARDLFGFYNGKLSNTTLIPATTIQFQASSSQQQQPLVIGSADRSTDTTFLKNAVLKRITYPTKGYTDFEFEPHRYNESGTVTYVPGLRVKRIVTFDGHKSISKLYKYGDSENGNGQKNFDLRGFFFYHEQLFRDWIALNFSSRQYRSRIFLSNSVIGPGFEDAPVVYPLVTEYENGSSVNGRTVYEFDNNTLIGDPLFTVPYSNKTFRNSLSWARGKLTKKTVYNSQNTKIAETTVSYTNYNDLTSNIGQAGTQWIIGDWQAQLFVDCGNFIEGKKYVLFNLPKTTGNYKETSRVETMFFGSLAHSTTVNRAYAPNYLLPTYEEQLVSSSPEAVRTNFRYPFDLVTIGSTYSGLSEALRQMLLKNMFAYPVEQYSSKKPMGSNDSETISGQITEYDLVPGTTFYQPKNIFLLEAASPITSYQFAIANPGGSTIVKHHDYKLRMRMDTYDTRGNLLQYSLEKGGSKNFIYGYDGAYLIGEAANSNGTTFLYTSFETNEKGGWTYSGTESRVMPGQAKTGRNVYLLNNGNITRSTYRGAYKLSVWVRKNIDAAATLTINGTSYSANVGNSWSLVEVTGSGGNITISGTNTVVDELRVHSANAMATTYTIVPLIGVWSQMDQKNHGTYYSYDPFGRLETIKNEDGHVLSHYEYLYIKP
jgi:hypothetical protein